ncbi:uncharacterized protein LOC142321100 [Lycorma delicatula]|uniref:uncharacterized protein LOC142321100 n=1 Tax=Lycorma delicatula TaxID=130591 RepID=UPI003F5192B4
MAFRTLFLVALTVVLVESSNYEIKREIRQNLQLKSNLTTNLVIGERVDGDRLIFESLIHVPTIKNGSQSLMAKFPPEGRNLSDKITFIKVEGVSNTDSPKIIKGGVNFKHVHFVFKCDSEHSKDYILSIYGKKKDEK